MGMLSRPGAAGDMGGALPSPPSAADTAAAVISAAADAAATDEADLLKRGSISARGSAAGSMAV